VTSRPLGLVLGDDGDRLDLVAAVESRHLACLVDLDVAGGLDAVDEIARHRRAQGAPHDEVDATGVGGQVHHRLSGRVPAADHDHVFARGL
jgi:hypothetical protein